MFTSPTTLPSPNIVFVCKPCYPIGKYPTIKGLNFPCEGQFWCLWVSLIWVLIGGALQQISSHSSTTQSVNYLASSLTFLLLSHRFIEKHGGRLTDSFLKLIHRSNTTLMFGIAPLSHWFDFWLMGSGFGGATVWCEKPIDGWLCWRKS